MDIHVPQCPELLGRGDEGVEKIGGLTLVGFQGVLVSMHWYGEGRRVGNLVGRVDIILLLASCLPAGSCYIVICSTCERGNSRWCHGAFLQTAACCSEALWAQ